MLLNTPVTTPHQADFEKLYTPLDDYGLLDFAGETWKRLIDRHTSGLEPGNHLTGKRLDSSIYPSSQDLTTDLNSISSLHTIIQCWPMRRWGVDMGHHLVRSILEAPQGKPAWFVSIEPEQSLSDPALLSPMPEWMEELEELEELEKGGGPVVIVVQLLGFRRPDEIVQFMQAVQHFNLHAMPNVRRPGPSKLIISLVLLAYLPITDLKFLRDQGIAVAQTRNNRSNLVAEQHCIPDELIGVSYPFDPLLVRRECEYSYAIAEREAGRYVEHRTSTPSLIPPLLESDKVRYTVYALQKLIAAQIAQKTVEAPATYEESPIFILAKEWASRLYQRIDNNRQLEWPILFESGLFRPDEAGPRPLALAVSAFLDAYFWAESQWLWEKSGTHKSVCAKEFRQAVLSYHIERARSKRRLGPEYHRTSSEVTSWLFLAIAVLIASPQERDSLLDAVALKDVWLSLDLRAIALPLMHNSGHAAPLTMTHRITRLITTSGNGMGLMFRSNLDSPRKFRPIHDSPPLSPALLLNEARAILQETADLDLTALFLASCAIDGDRDVLDESLWSAIIPESFLHVAKTVGTAMSRESVAIGNGVRISSRVIMIEDWLSAFPGLRRYHRPHRHALELPWLSTYILAHACGARLPIEDELIKAFKHRVVQENALDAREISGDDRRLSPLARFEWLASTEQSPVHGSEFLRTGMIDFFRRLVRKAYVYRPQWDRNNVAQCSAHPATTAEPNRLQIAYCRLAFQE